MIRSKYALLPGKAEILYTNVLGELDTLGPFTPEYVLLDYEKAFQNAVLAVWPGTTLRCCYFHYKQALWRKLAQSDLVPEYKVAGSDVRKSLQIIGALPFLLNGDDDMAWRLLRPTFPPEMSPFADYMDYTWSGMLPSSDFQEAPTSQRDSTTGQKCAAKVRRIFSIM